MNDPNQNYQNHPGPVVINPPNSANPQQGAMNYGFSTDELRVLRECNVESFYQRSLPIGVGMGVATFMAVQKGILTASTKFGPTPKVVVAGIMGYFIGKFSYQEKCAEKMMKLPNSRLGEALRRRKKGEYFEQINPDGGLSLSPFASTTDVYSDETLKGSQNNSLDLDIERPANFGLDDTYRPSIDTPDRSFNDNLPLEAPKTTTTYEELRRRNREDYEKKAANPYYRPIPQDEAPTVIRQRERPPVDDYPLQSGPKNIYGDIWSK
ncbi:OCIA domain-containing protein 1 [Chironomus tepperi]|uniref:OCIA domain-containing protein 1 n=1 Tax=Chironomus tepperi TaxID=113505 RepID=UPI00391FA12C